MIELSSRAPANLDTGRWSSGETFAFVLAASVALWTLIAFALWAVL